MKQYLVHTSKNINYGFLVEAENSDEAQDVFERLEDTEVRKALVYVDVSNMDTPWGIDEASADDGHETVTDEYLHEIRVF